MSVVNGLKMTDVGVIPEDWDIEPLGALIGSLDAGVSVRSAADNTASYGHDVMVLKTSCISKGRFKPAEAKAVISAELSRVKTPAKGGSMLISRMNTPDLVGEVGYVPQDWPNLYLPDRLWMTCPAAGRKTDMRWLTALLAHGPAGRSLRDAATGTSGSMKNIGKAALRAVLIPSPTPAEQSAIAEALSDMDEAIEAQEAVIAKNRALKTATMQALLSGTRRLPGFSGEWEEKRLGDAAVLKARIGWQGLTTEEYLEAGDFYLVTGTDFQDGYVDWENCCFVDEWRYRQDRNIQLQQGDVLVTKDGTLGKVALVSSLPGCATLNSGVFVIRPRDHSFVPEFFYFVLRSRVFSEFLDQLSAGSTITHLYQKDFVNFKFRTPPTLEEQIGIAAVLADMDAEHVGLKARLAKLRDLKAGMMQELLTGKIRLV